MGLCVSVIQRTRTWDSLCLTNRGLWHGTLCVCHTEDLDMGFCVSDLKRTMTWDRGEHEWDFACLSYKRL